MNQTEEVLLNTPLFSDISKEDLPKLLSCLCAQTKQYVKNQFLYLPGDTIDHLGVVLSGQVQIQREDLLGNRMILARLGQGDLFGETFVCAQIEKIPVGIMAMEDATVLQVDYGRIMHSCPAACGYHHQIVRNMLMIVASKNMYLNRKIEFLSKRTTREKVWSFLLNQAQQADSLTFDISFNRQELADYLCVDRSALSSELGKMKKEGMITFQKNRFTIEKGTMMEEYHLLPERD